MQASDIPDSAKKALTEDLEVDATHPDRFGPHEVAVISGENTYFVNYTVGFCTCLADQYDPLPCKHRMLLKFATGEVDIPDFVDMQIVSPYLRRVCSE